MGLESNVRWYTDNGINLLLLLTAVTLLTDSRDVALLAERPAVVTVYAGVVHVEENAAGDALEVFRVPGLTQGFDRVLERSFYWNYSLRWTELTVRIKPLQAAHLGTNLFL